MAHAEASSGSSSAWQRATLDVSTGHHPVGISLSRSGLHGSTAGWGRWDGLHCWSNCGLVLVANRTHAPTDEDSKRYEAYAVMILQTAHKQYQVSKVVLKVGHAESVFLRF
jgi:hypothetical protein